jgi:hypothetical protein
LIKLRTPPTRHGRDHEAKSDTLPPGWAPNVLAVNGKPPPLRRQFVKAGTPPQYARSVQSAWAIERSIAEHKASVRQIEHEEAKRKRVIHDQEWVGAHFSCAYKPKRGRKRGPCAWRAAVSGA